MPARLKHSLEHGESDKFASEGFHRRDLDSLAGRLTEPLTSLIRALAASDTVCALAAATSILADSSYFWSSSLYLASAAWEEESERHDQQEEQQQHKQQQVLSKH